MILSLSTGYHLCHDLCLQAGRKESPKISPTWMTLLLIVTLDRKLLRYNLNKNSIIFVLPQISALQVMKDHYEDTPNFCLHTLSKKYKSIRNLKSKIAGYKLRAWILRLCYSNVALEPTIRSILGFG